MSTGGCGEARAQDVTYLVGMLALKELPDKAQDVLERQGVAFVYAPDGPRGTALQRLPTLSPLPARDAEARRA